MRSQRSADATSHLSAVAPIKAGALALAQSSLRFLLLEPQRELEQQAAKKPRGATCCPLGGALRAFSGTMNQVVRRGTKRLRIRRRELWETIWAVRDSIRFPPKDQPEPMEVDPPPDEPEPMEVDPPAGDEEEPMEVDMPPAKVACQNPPVRGMAWRKPRRPSHPRRAGGCTAIKLGPVTSPPPKDQDEGAAWRRNICRRQTERSPQPPAKRTG